MEIVKYIIGSIMLAVLLDVVIVIFSIFSIMNGEGVYLAPFWEAQVKFVVNLIGFVKQ